MKVTAAVSKEIKKLNPAVAEAVEEFKRRRRTRRVTFDTLPGSTGIYLAEGAEYTWFRPDGDTLKAQMVSEYNLGKRDTSGLDYRVGQRTPPLPEGTWCFETSLLMGQWYGHLVYVGPMQPAEGGA